MGKINGTVNKHREKDSYCYKVLSELPNKVVVTQQN